MTRKIYRTAQGKLVDLGALQLQNENVRAVGNMNVNARGDLLDGFNRPVSTRNEQVKKQYRKQTSNVSDQSVNAPKGDPTPRPARPAKPAVVDIPKPPEDFNDDFVKPAESKSPAAAAPANEGLAAAIARARQIKQEPVLSPRQQAQNKPGVTKI